MFPLERTARRQTGAWKTKKNIQTPYFRIYSWRALFDLPKLCMVAEEVKTILKGANLFSIRCIVFFLQVHGKIRGK